MRDSPGPRREELLLNHHQLNGREPNKFEENPGLQVDRQSFWPKRAPRRLAESLVKQGPDQGPAATGQSQGPSPAVPLVESKPGFGRNWTESGTKSCGTTGRVQTRDQFDEGQSLRTKPNAIQAGIHAHNWKQEQQGLTGSGILTGLQGSEEGLLDQRQHWNRQQDNLDGDFSPQVSRGNRYYTLILADRPRSDRRLHSIT
ncbi:hypothetical protein TNCT_419151 [Trichonephila clavata]|uniref:Uncharacterized protein n=1 Tax=Trichonephila clavata TaxID=2740835 RepID=A0A8X6KMR5_TRICU|nr:hypothetical protein TNCT_419151 [Trichonephila clavata]